MARQLLNLLRDYCKPCAYNPKNRTGEDACPFTTLYWDFLDRHAEEFSKNHRMFQQYSGLKRLDNIPEVKERAREVLEGLGAGKI